MSIDKFEEELLNLGIACRFVQLTKDCYIIEDSLGNIVNVIVGDRIFTKRLPDRYVGDSFEGDLEYIRRLMED